MDGRKYPISLHDPYGGTDAVAAPTGPVHEGSSVSYFGSAQQISEGFAIALRAMGVGADILPAELAPRNTNSNREDS
jgi:hypothetical protein